MSLRDQLQAIYDEQGKLTPKLVLDTARDPEHPLHSHFEWRDDIAAERYRLDQARTLIRSVRVVYKPAETEEQAPIAGRAYHAVRDVEDEYRYEPAEKVAADPLLTKLVLADMEREWRGLKRRYEQFAEFHEMVRRDLEAMPADEADT